MAIDPTISLRAGQNVPQFDPMAAAERGLKLGELMMRPDILQQQLASARAAEELTRQQTLASQQAQKLTAEQTAKAEQDRLAEARNLEGDKWLDANAHKFLDRKTGKFDNEALIDAYLQTGHPYEKLAKFRERANKEVTERLKTKTDQVDYIDGRMRVISNLMDRMPKTPDGERQARSLLNNEVASLQSTFGPELTSESVSRYFGESAIPGADKPQMVQTPGGGIAVAPPRAPSLFDRARQTMESTRTEEQRIQEGIKKQEIAVNAGHLEVSRRQVALAENLANASPQDKDPNSEISKKVRSTLEFIKAPPEIWQGRSSFEIARDPAAQAYLKSITPSAQTRSEDVARLEEVQTQLKPYEKGLNAAARLSQLPTYAGGVAQDLWDKYVARNSDAKEFQAALDAYNAKNKTNYSVPKDGLGPVATLINNEYAALSSKAEGLKSSITQPTTPQAAEKIRPGTVQVKRLSDNVVVTIPASDLQTMLRTGKYEKVK